MRRRLRNYVAVVMTLLLCMGLWFQHGQEVQAAQTATVYIIADDANGSQVTISNVDISGVTLNVSEVGIVNSAEGTFSLPSEQIKLNGRTLFGLYPTDDRVEGTQLNLRSIDANGLRITSDTDTGGIIIELYGAYGAAHKVTYNSNILGTQNDAIAEVTYFQDDKEKLQGIPYNHPGTPTFSSEAGDTTWTKEGYLFTGWGVTDSGGVNAPETFDYEEKTETSITFFAQWQEAAFLTITYIPSENLEGYDNYAYQQTLTDTAFSFVTEAEPSPPTDYSIFEGWSYTNASGATVIIGAGETCSDIPITTTAVTMTAVWKEPLAGGSTVSAGTYTLLAGQAYTLGSGSWTVTYNGSGDSCTYTGGREFYVAATGEYTFAGK